jgi:hypothetical protein
MIAKYTFMRVLLIKGVALNATFFNTANNNSKIEAAAGWLDAVVN